MYLSVFFSHFLRVSVCPDDRRGRVSSGGHLSQTKMGPKIQNPKGQKSYDREESTLESDKQHPGE